MASLSDNDSAQLLKDLLRIDVSSKSFSADDTRLTSSVVLQDNESPRLTNDAVVSESNFFSSSDSARRQGMPLLRSKQQIVLFGEDTNNVYSIYSQDVEIVANESTGSTMVAGSSCQQELSHSSATLIGIHWSKDFVAYAVKGKTDDSVQVFNCSTAEHVLLKTFSGSVIDVAFAYCSAVILACVDGIGDLHVFKILTLSNGKLKSEVLLHLKQPSVDPGSLALYSRVVWCHFVPERRDDDGEETSAEMVLAFSSDNKVRVLNVDAVRMLHNEALDLSKLTSGSCLIDCHLQCITDMALVPDGSTLATASVDGFVRCFELDLFDFGPPRCVFKWKPHDGRPVSSIFFLDDLKSTSLDAQFWKFAITGADENRELKLWNCETWTCLQTVTFSLAPSTVSQNIQMLPCLKAQLNSSASYLVLSDIRHKVLYVLHILKRDYQDLAHIFAVSEFHLVQPCLTFAIHDVTEHRKPVTNFPSPQMPAAVMPSSSCISYDFGSADVDRLMGLYVINTKYLEHLSINLNPYTTDDQISSSQFLPGCKSAHHKNILSEVNNLSGSESSVPAFARSSCMVLTNTDKILEFQGLLQEISVLLKEQHGGGLPNYLLWELHPADIFIDSTQKKIHNLERMLISSMESSIACCQRRTDDFMKQISKDLDLQEDQQHQHQLTMLSQVLSNRFHLQLCSSTEWQMQQFILPEFSHSFAPVARRLNEEVSSKVIAADSCLKENIKQLLKLKTMTDYFGKANAKSIETVLCSTFHDQLIPSFDRGCQNIVSQMDNAFLKGFHTYVDELLKQTEKLQKQLSEMSSSPVLHHIERLISVMMQAKESREVWNLHLTQLIHLIQCHIEIMEKMKAKQDSGFNEAVNSLPKQLIDSAVEICHNETGSLLKKSQAAVSEQILMFQQPCSPALTSQGSSLPHCQRMHVLQLVQHNQINEAFQQALSATDLSLVMYLCEMVNPAEVFAKSPIALDQPVLLSLIQQLSADLQSQTSLKCSYLGDALLNIEVKSSVIQEHLPMIIEQLSKNANAILQQSECNESLRKSLKMLILTARCLLPSGIA